MKRLRTILLTLFAVALWLASLGLGWIWWKRAGLPYNEDGRYFHQATSTVLHDQAVMVYGLLALVFLVLAVGVKWWVRRSLRRTRSPKI